VGEVVVNIGLYFLSRSCSEEKLGVIVEPLSGNKEVKCTLSFLFIFSDCF